MFFWHVKIMKNEMKHFLGKNPNNLQLAKRILKKNAKLKKSFT